jgi:hypothetical protein
MHRAHFKAIALVVTTLRQSSMTVNEFVDFVRHLANTLSRFNEHFDHDKFIEACGVTDILAEVATIRAKASNE